MPDEQPNNPGGRVLEIEGQRVAAGPADVRPTTHPVRVTEELKLAAMAASTAFASLNPDDFAGAEIEAVSLKYDGLEAAQAVARAARHLAEYFARRHWQMQNVTVSVEADGTQGWVNLPWNLVLPAYFDTLFEDTAKTKLELLEVDCWLVEAARLYNATFPSENLIRIDLVPQGEEGKSVECLQCEVEVPVLLAALREFAAALVKAAVTGPHHVVTIAGKELADLGIKRDGEVVEFEKRNAALRALLALACLRKKPTFTVEAFEKLYMGERKPKGKSNENQSEVKQATEPGKTFNNAMNELRAFFPHVTYENDRELRRVSGLAFKSVPAEVVIHAVLRQFYRE